MIMSNYYTSDLHLFDRSVISSASRPHKNLEEMHKDIIIKWNKKIKNSDTVYILGDLALPRNNKETKEVINILNLLNGKKVLIIGNHDRDLIKNESFNKCFNRIEEYCRILDEGKKVILFHFPIEDWESKRKGAIHLHGHIHKKKINDIKNRYHVGCDLHKFIPVSLKEIIKKD